MGFQTSYITNTQVPVSIVDEYAQQPFKGSSTVTKTFTSPMTGVVISNDGEDGTVPILLQVNGFDFEVYPGEVFGDRFYPFTEVTIVSNSVPFRAYVKGPGAPATP